MSQKLFIIDMSRCIGCNACTIACKDRAGLPDDIDFLRLERVESGLYPNIDMYYRVMHCFHCEKPQCIDACSSNAIVKNKDGFVLLDETRCIGCGKCKIACPFESVVELPNGVFKKCDGCYDEVANGFDPTCVRACLTRTLSFEFVEGLNGLDRIDEDFNDYGIGPSVIYQVKRKLN